MVSQPKLFEIFGEVGLGLKRLDTCGLEKRNIREHSGEEMMIQTLMVKAAARREAILAREVDRADNPEEARSDRCPLNLCRCRDRHLSFRRIVVQERHRYLTAIRMIQMRQIISIPIL